MITPLPALVAFASLLCFLSATHAHDIGRHHEPLQRFHRRASQSSPSPSPPTRSPAPYWFESIAHIGRPAFNPDPNYRIFRNVREFGAKGDGSTDDYDAINRAMSTGPNRCGGSETACDSRTTTPAIIYFPSGTYRVSKPINGFYYTHIIGDPLNLPIIKPLPSFEGMAVIDVDPYKNNGTNWFTNQNNFFRQVRNLVIDLTALPSDRGAGIHWQVGQATSLQNIRFEMIRGKQSKQQGIFMDNGSGGFMADLVFNGGRYGAFLGNQQFTSRNLTFNNCQTAIFMNWNWGWTFKSVSINDCEVGIDMSNGADNQTVGSVILLDSHVANTPVGVRTAFSDKSIPNAGGSLLIENTEFTDTAVAVQQSGHDTNDKRTILPGNTRINSWVQGRSYVGVAGTRLQKAINGPNKSAQLLKGNEVFERSKPQYENLPVSAFVSVRTFGAKGDGKTDDTQAIQRAVMKVTPDQVLFFDHGAYLVSDTVVLPTRIRITGEIWPLIMATGPKFADPALLRPVFQVGCPGQTGAVELSELMFETKGPAPGAILVQWNLNGEQGANGMWDVHARVGGSAGTMLQSDKCSRKSDKNVKVGDDPECFGAGILFHATKTASVYVENSWFWVADHELDSLDHNQLTIHNGRGVLLESQNPVWLVGTASEHSVLYNYQLSNASNVWMGFVQAETPYFQSNPGAPGPFRIPLSTDPNFEHCQTAGCRKSWGLRIVDSNDVFVYGAGLYSFFENYEQQCVSAQNCQENMISVEGDATNLRLFSVSTKASVNMISSSFGNVLDLDNRSNFCGTVALWTAS